MQHGEIEKGRAARCEIFGQAANQRLADARMACRRVDGEAPQGRPALGIVEGADVVDSGHSAEHLAGLLILGDEIDDRAGVALGPEEFRRDGDHRARRVDAVDRLGVGLGRQPADEETLRSLAGRAVARQIQPERMRRIEEQFLRRIGEQDMRIAHIDRDISPVGLFAAQGGNHCVRFLEGLGEDQPAPPAIENRLRRHAIGIVAMLGYRRLQALIAHALEAMLVGLAGLSPARIRRLFGAFAVLRHGEPYTPWVCNHISSSATCHSSEPRSGVMWLAGSSNRVSR